MFGRIIVESTVGTYIEDAIKEAILYANNTSDADRVALTFNGVEVPVKDYKKDSTVIEVRRLTDIYDDYKKQSLVESYD